MRRPLPIARPKELFRELIRIAIAVATVYGAYSSWQLVTSHHANPLQAVAAGIFVTSAVWFLWDLFVCIKYRNEPLQLLDQVTICRLVRSDRLLFLNLLFLYLAIQLIDRFSNKPRRHL